MNNNEVDLMAILRARLAIDMPVWQWVLICWVLLFVVTFLGSLLVFS